MQKNLVRVIGLIMISLLEYVLVTLPGWTVEVVDTAWVRRYNGPGNSTDAGNAIIVDGTGNIYVAGYSRGIETARDYATIKYYPDGDTAWLRTYTELTGADDYPNAMALDGSGNIYLTGTAYHPEIGRYYGTIKYSVNGDTAWLRRYDGPGHSNDEAVDIAIDDSGNVYVTGVSFGGDTGQDYATLKYNPNGDTVWVRTYNTSGSLGDAASAIAVDGSGNVYVTGASVDSATRTDYATIKYHANGDTHWVRRYDGPANSSDWASDIVVDGSGNVYVTGRSTGIGTDWDCATIKYYPDGDTAWVIRYNGLADSTDFAKAIALDYSGNVYVTGYSYVSGSGYDYLTIKYYPNGDTVWVRTYNGPGNSEDDAVAIAVDGSGNVYVTGDSWGSGTGRDYATVKYDPDGYEFWVERYHGPGNSADAARAIALDDSGNFYVTGASVGSGTDFDFTTIKYVVSDSIPFAPAVNYEAGNLRKSVFCADLDGDADLDLAAANTYSNAVSILANNGDATFHLDSSYLAGDNPHSLFCADLDGDGDLDIAVGGRSEWSNVSILKNKGDGTFDSAVDCGVGGESGCVFCSDLDGDTDLDLAVTESWGDSVSILKNNGDGTFDTAVNYASGDTSVFCADLDGDTDLDLAVADCWGNNVSILKNNADGTFDSAVNYGTGSHPLSLFCGDLDGDADLDLAVANRWGDNVSILKNNGDATFDSAVNYVVGIEPVAIFCADLDGDTNLDLAVANYWGDNISILKNNGDGSFQTAVNYQVGDSPNSVFCADLDADGDFDLAVGTSDGVCILENLTQVPANQPPWAFDLVSPSESDTTFRVVNFDWQDAYDPNFGDQIRYDLYVSTSEGFGPLSTTIDSNLLVSKHSDTLENGTYYWKVKAKDNWGAYIWSSESRSFFNSDTIPDPLFVIAFSPVDMVVTDPLGDSIGLDFSTIPNATYDTTTDWNGDGDNDDIVIIPDPWVGTYRVAVKAEPMGEGDYDLGIRINGGEVNLIAQDQPVPSPGEVDTFSYDLEPDYDTTDVRIEEKDDLLETFDLFQNYPNPFNVTTQIRFILPKPGFVSLKIYDILGRKTRTLVSEHLPGGYMSVVWDGKDDSGKEVASGIYFYQLKTGDFRETRKLVLLK